MGKREDNKRHKLARLEEEGLRLFLRDGYDRTSIEQIAQAVGVARGTYYLYFPDKLSLFNRLIDQWYTQVLELLTKVAERLNEATTRQECLAIYQEMGIGLAMIALGNRDSFLLTFREARRSGEAGDGLRTRELELFEVICGYTIDAVNRGLISSRNPKLTTLMVFGAVERLYYEFLLDNDIGPVDEVVEDVVSMFAKSMGLPVTSPPADVENQGPT
ncbi:MAG: TetR/AcrR family transcriptional regulator [Proteobacteria bacterium]|nr:TetR/AcrR family transcriptional regulator [Pseudomonadota bacterium]